MGNKLNLEDEVIDGYQVSSKMKEIWQVELDLLGKFINVCDKYNIKYFIISGSLIGAIRHNGFIPWDDDIDLGMMREDYIKLLKIADIEFKDPYFFQTPYNDDLYRGHAQLRNSHTSAILPNEIHLNHNQGIFIDIFPFDEYPKNEFLCRIQKIRCRVLEKIMKHKFRKEHPTIKSKILYLICRSLYKIFGYKNIYAHYEKVCSKYNGRGCGYISNLAFKYGRPKYKHKKEYFEELTEHQFHYLNVKIPKAYDAILSKQYGNYMEYVIGTSVHGFLYQSATISYKEYLKQLRGDIHEEI